MKRGAWFWGMGCTLAIAASVTGWLPWIPGVLLWLPSGLFALVAGSFCVGRRGLATPARLLACFFAALMAVVCAFHLPLKMGFGWSKDSLEALAARKPPEGGLNRLAVREWAGVYRVRSVESDAAGTVFCWIVDTGSLRAGFAKSTLPKIDRARNEVDLGGGWRYVIED